MKKLTKKSLDELAENALNVSELEQQTIIGGAFYFDYSGNYLGSSGPGSDIRIATGLGSISTSIPFSEAASSTVGGVLTNMAHLIGYSGTVGTDFFENPGKYAQAAGGQITYNMGSPAFDQGNYFDFLCTLIHENHHVITPYDAGTPQSEYYAYRAVKDSYFYSLVSNEYRAHIESSYNHYGSLLGYSFF
ncbi:hypothetical protein SAMN05216357_111106 [Porphyromonadaceae bacterium KH3CP3RA]|nr:hypothetical protein SAMN05216357_111106 [Porphyromonadaceae bacterium KH3CP3RA]